MTNNSLMILNERFMGFYLVSIMNEAFQLNFCDTLTIGTIHQLRLDVKNYNIARQCTITMYYNIAF